MGLSLTLDRQGMRTAIMCGAVGADPEFALCGIDELWIFSDHSVRLRSWQLRVAVAGSVFAVPQVVSEPERFR